MGRSSERQRDAKSNEELKKTLRTSGFAIFFFKFFRGFFKVFASFFEFSELLGPAWTFSDAFGWVWMRLDPFGSTRTRSENFRKIGRIILGFRHF